MFLKLNAPSKTIRKKIYGKHLLQEIPKPEMTFDSFLHTSNKFCTTDTTSNVKCGKRESFSESTIMQHHKYNIHTPPSTTNICIHIYYTKDFKNKQRSLREPPDLCPTHGCSNDQHITKITPTSTYLCILATT